MASVFEVLAARGPAGIAGQEIPIKKKTTE